MYLALQFFEKDSLLPPPFTLMSFVMWGVKWAVETNCGRGVPGKKKKKGFAFCSSDDINYRTIIMQFIDNAKPQPDHAKPQIDHD